MGRERFSRHDSPYLFEPVYHAIMCVQCSVVGFEKRGRKSVLGSVLRRDMPSCEPLQIGLYFLDIFITTHPSRMDSQVT